ncbi:MarR family winged helix-turn-helix transcriptional regulator [Roseateles sp.]|jgi:DNA-binding MarR family transcriptional regulator|uniref:MarR family winged helix-turn-helix transcriptional regulator n=1 Tax=Roseateles sp. TaxID=1971397 RepID=UPI0037CB062C
MSRVTPRFYQPDNYRREESLGWLLKRAMATIVHQGDRRLTPLGLTHAQWSPLLRLRLSGPAPAATLAAELDIDPGAATRLLDRLQAKGLIQRERTLEDRRVVMVSLTAAGQEATAGVPVVLAEIFNDLLTGFSDAECRTLISLLQRLVVNGEALRGRDRAPNDEPI